MAGRRSSSRAPTLQPIRIVLIEPRTLAGLGIRRILELEPDLEVVAQVRTADDAIDVVGDLAPDVVVLDVELQEPSNTEASHRLAIQAPDSGIVVVGREDEDASILEAIEIGAMGHLSALADPADLVAVIRKVADGQDPLRDEVIGRPDLIDKIMEGFRDSLTRAEQRASNPLSPRELEVLRHVARGRRNREVAGLMDVSEQTIKNHVSTILHKLGVPNRVRAVTFAVRQGWLVLDAVPADVSSEGSGPEA
jgi:DNA-binding NarL/FixJ family response regulator